MPNQSYKAYVAQVFEVSKRLLDQSGEDVFLHDLVTLRRCVEEAVLTSDNNGNGRYDQVCPVVESVTNFQFLQGEALPTKSKL